VQEKEERLVEKDVLAVKVKQCRNALVAKVNEVLLLEQEHAQVQKELEAQRNATAVSCPCWLPTCMPSLSFALWNLARQSIELLTPERVPCQLHGKFGCPAKWPDWGTPTCACCLRKKNWADWLRSAVMCRS